MGDDPRFFPMSFKVGFDPHGDPDKPFYTLQQHTYDDGLISMEVPANFKTDLTTHPKNLHWWLLAACPFAYFFNGLLWIMVFISIVAIWVRDPLGKHQRAALFHDRNYQVQKHPRHTVDAVYYAMMRVDGVGKIRCLLHYAGVRVGGWVAWTKNARSKD